MINVVIAEDDYRIGSIHEKFLNKVPGFNVVGKALTGKETLKLINENDVDLLLLDIYMPDILGSEVMSEIRKINLKIDIIIISAATEKEIVKEVMRLGAMDYILKPVEMKRFIRTLELYREMKQSLKGRSVFDQKLLDNYFRYSKLDGVADNDKATPKGIDPITLDKVENAMYKNNNQGITAEEMGEQIGVTRTTARRYLEYLISQEILRAELEYGTVGRPERQYFLIE